MNLNSSGRRPGHDSKAGDRKIQPQTKGNGTGKETVFHLVAATARNVMLAADFTGWKEAPIKMVRSAGGIWNIKVTLPPGKYRYRFLIDPDAPRNPAGGRSAPLPFGTLHGEVEVRI